MKRRDFLGMLGAAAAWPEVMLAQQDGSHRIPTVGFLGFASAAIERQRAGSVGNLGERRGNVAHHGRHGGLVNRHC